MPSAKLERALALPLGGGHTTERVQYDRAMRRAASHSLAPPNEDPPASMLADQAFSRATGAPLVDGNSVRVLRDAAENYPAWEEAINGARFTIHVEMYIIHHDHAGRRFVDLLASRAREGVTVRVAYDWFGCGSGPFRGLFRPLVAAGGEVRAFNPPSVTAALGWVRRNHRKLVAIDSRIAFVGGLCVGDAWVGRPDRGQAPWRDTGTEITGPAVAHAERSFAQSWRLAGGQIDATTTELTTSVTEGNVRLRLVATEPFSANVLRLDLLVASLARRNLWITDAYFVGHGPYLDLLRNAARDGVDVRLLLPQGSDVGWSVPISRTLYRALLESGVRIFEWNGSMVHGKTAVADGQWARIGSTNLNLASWIANWELDVVFDDEATARTLEAHYLADLEQSTEIRFDPVRRRLAARQPTGARARARRSARRTLRTVGGLSRSLGAAITSSRPLEDFEHPPLLVFGLALIALGSIAVTEPRLLAWPIGLLAGWSGLTFIAETIGFRRKRSRQ